MYFTYRLFDHKDHAGTECATGHDLLYVIPCKGQFEFGREKLGCFVSISNCDLGRIPSALDFGEVAKGWL